MTARACLFALLCACPAQGAEPPAMKPLADDYADWFRARVQEARVVGASFAIVERDQIVLLGAYGHADERRSRAVTADTVFRIASVSKTFAAGLTAQLVQDGYLGWADPVTRYLPEFRLRGDASAVRIEDLLGQSSGLIPHAFDNLIEDGVAAEIIRARLAELTPLCTPGTCYSYQNTVFSLIEPVVERVTGAGYAQLLERRIFRPLAMANASVGYEPFLATFDRAEPHVRRNGRWRTVAVQPNYYRVAPAAGVNASARDMAKWLMAQFGVNPLVLRSQAVAALIVPRVRTPRDLYRKEWRRLLTDAHYGLGWRIYRIGDEPIAYHSGWVTGYRADVAWSPRLRIGIAVLLNVEDATINALTTHFWEQVLGRFAPTRPAASP